MKDDKQGILIADIDFKKMAEIRVRMPLVNQRRDDVVTIKAIQFHITDGARL